MTCYCDGNGVVLGLETMRKRIRLFYAKQVQHPLNGNEVLAHILKPLASFSHYGTRQEYLS